MTMPPLPAPDMTDQTSPLVVAYKALKGAGVWAISTYAAPVVAASIGFPPLMVAGLMVSAGHAVLNLIGQKTGLSWL